MTEKITELEIPYAKIWAVLHADCGAAEKMDDGFPYHWPKCREYRFGGSLGSGGKIWAYDGRWYVNCYSEHMTPRADSCIKTANAKLAELHRVSLLSTDKEG